MSDDLGPSRKRFKQADLKSFLTTMRETRESCNGGDLKPKKHESPIRCRQSSGGQIKEEPPIATTECDSKDLEDLESSQELFPGLGAPDSSASEGAVVDANDAFFESTRQGHTSVGSSTLKEGDVDGHKAPDRTLKGADVDGHKAPDRTPKGADVDGHKTPDRTLKGADVGGHKTPDSCDHSSKSHPTSDSEESVAGEDGDIPENFRRTPHCSSSCPEMSPGHTVLCRVVQTGGSRKPCPLVPYPEVLVDKWDGAHVRMPCSPQSQFPVELGSGTSTLGSRWELIESSLLAPIHDAYDLVKAIRKYNGRASVDWNFRSLHKFIEQELDIRESQSFFEVVLPKMIALALRLPTIVTQPIPLLKCGQDRTLSMSQLQVGSLLANAFFCTFPRRNTRKSNSEYCNYPDINFNRLFSGPGDEAVKMEKLKCIVNYFRRITKDAPTGMVTFHRQILLDPIDWSTSKTELADMFVTESGYIEREGHGMLQVDFANKFIGGGVLGGGCVQEEIRFMICPEMIVSRLFTEALGPREVLVITGAEQYNVTSGYADKFLWESDFRDQSCRDSWERKCTEVVAMDALCFSRTLEQYKPANIKRELNKAYCGFMCPEKPSAELSAIATGNWGCGAFRGDPQLKAIIQLMASSAAGRGLVYFTFGDKRLCQNLRALYDFLKSRCLTVGDLYQLLVGYSQYRSQQTLQSKSSLFEYLYSTCMP